MGKIVIFGHTGFIGRALHEHLLGTSGGQVMGFSSEAVDLRRRDGLHILEGLVDQNAIVIFASAITPEKGDSLDVLVQNTLMAGHLGMLLEAHPPAKCVCFSSDVVYPMQDDPITEKTSVHPRGTFYGIAKYATECVLRRSAESGGFPLLVLRPTGVFGAGDTHGVYGPNAFLRTLINDRAVRLFGDGEEKRDHLYIGDLVRLVGSLLAVDAVGVYNLATGVSHSYAEVVECLRRVVPFDFSLSRVPRRGPVTHRCFDISRLRAQVPQFRFTSMEQGLREAFMRLSLAPDRV